MADAGLTRTLSPELSAGLNLARAGAAFYVVVYHVCQNNVSGPASLPLRFGQEAVIVFFLLSGFVIFANERNRADIEPFAYLLRRLRRIYPTLLVAIVLTISLWALDDDYDGSFRLGELIATLTSLQDTSALKPGVIADPVLNNSPLWSLSYEMAFYLFFPVVLRFRRRVPNLTTPALSCLSVTAYLTYLIAPNHLSLMVAYFLVWWSGARLAEIYLDSRVSLRQIRGIAVGLAVLTATSLVPLVGEAHRGVGMFPLLMTRHFLFSLLLILFTITPITGLLARLALRIAPVAAFLASISYGVYVFHYPMLLNWSVAKTPMGFLAAAALLIALATVGDRQLNRWLPKPRLPKGRPIAGRGNP